MFQYRKILQMHNEEFSLRSIAAATGHSRQKVTEVVEKATERQLSDSLTEEMTDKWLEEFLFSRNRWKGLGIDQWILSIFIKSWRRKTLI